MFDYDTELEPSVERMHELLQLAGERVIQHVSTIAVQRVCDNEDFEELAQSVREPLPERGTSYEGLLARIFDQLVHKGFNAASPGALSYVNGGGLFPSAIADLIVAAINPFIGYWAASPGFAELETTVVRWFCDMLGMPQTAGGVLVSGGSMANLSAIIAARRARFEGDFSNGTLYASDQVHHSVKKAVMLAGFPESVLRAVPTDSRYRLLPDALAAAVAQDRRAGFEPCCVIATAGTTNSGAVDPLSTIADVASSEGLWFHVDAAYGGFFALTARGKAALRGIERADSVTIDPHKSLFLPFGTGCLIARNVDTLRRSHQLDADYLSGMTSLTDRREGVNFGEISPEMSRNARGLRVWLPLKMLGAQAFRSALDEKLDLALWATAQLAVMPGFEVVAEPQLSTLAFRAAWPGYEAAEQDALNHRVLERVNRSGRVHMSATRLDGRFTLRMCILSFRTHHDAVAACLEELQSALRAEVGIHGCHDHASMQRIPVAVSASL